MEKYVGIEIVEGEMGQLEVVDIYDQVETALFVDGTTVEYVKQRNCCFAYTCDPLAKKDGIYFDAYGKKWKKIA